MLVLILIQENFRWDTSGTRSGQITLPMVTGDVGMFAYDHINFATTSVDDVSFAGIAGLPDDIYQHYEIYFSCQPQTSDTLVMTFQGETGGEINGASDYSYHLHTNVATSALVALLQ